MRITKTLIPRLAVAAGGAALLGACSGTGDATRSLTPGARSADIVATLPPTLIAIAPSNGPTAGGNTVTLIGNQFDASTHVTVGSQSVPNLTVISATQVTFPMVAGEGNSVPVVLSTNMGATPPRIYSYDPPVIINVTPAVGPSSGGTQVTLTGNNFGVNPAVQFGGNNAAVVSHSHTQIVVTSPAGTPGGLATARVTVAGQVSNAADYRYAAPSITGIAPNHGPTVGGTLVTLTGESFGSDAQVFFNGTLAPAVSRSQTSAVFAAPAGQGSAVVTVLGGPGATSNAVAFNYDAPTVSDIQPTSGPISGGTQITIHGTNFGLTPTVAVGGNVAPLVSATHTSIVATTPAGLPGAAPVVVAVAGQSSNAAALFTYIAPKPQIVNMSPATGPTAGGTTVTLTGSNFGASPHVTVAGTVVAAVPTIPNSQLTFTMPEGEGTAPVVVTASGQSSDAVNFAYNAPTIGSIVPNPGPSSGGYPVTLTGNNFGLHPTVAVDAANASVVSSSHTRIVFTAPAADPGHDAQVRVTVAGQTSNTSTFHYNAPALANISPSHGPTSGGTTVTVTGSGFGAAPSVLVNGAAAPIISASQSQIVFTSTAGQGSASVVVAAGATRSNALTFNYDAPTIASLSPTSGPVAGGTRVTINGANFGLTPTVTFGGTLVPLIASTHSQIILNSPAGTPTTVPVVVTVTGKASNAMSYQYVCPDGTVISNGACVTPVAALGNVVTALPAEAQAQLAPLVADVTSKLTDDNPNNDNGACGQLNALSKQTAALLKTGKISTSDAAAVNGAIALVSGKAGCK